MQNLRFQLPPVNSLVAFEAAARHLSFTRAGEELRVTREAVSRQIRGLENHLGVKLFVRRHRALDLTSQGAEFRVIVQHSLDAIATSARSLQRARQPSRITVTATIAIATYWLTPRLPRFRAAKPDAEIRVVVSDRPGDMATEGIDVGLRYGEGKWPGVIATHLFDVQSLPVCSPGYLEKSTPIRDTADLVEHTLLNLDGAPHAEEDWPWWLAKSGVTLGGPLNILGFDNYANVIQAALEGQGVALGFSRIVDDLLGRGQLLRPVPAQLDPGYAAYIVVPSGSQPTPAAQNFFDWILAEAADQPSLPD